MVMDANRAESTDEVAMPSDEEVRAKLRMARPGLRFNEVMTGMITMGITDPVKGYQSDAAIAMRLHATVTIPNLPGFIKDPIHKGQWRAQGSIPVLGGNVIGMGEGDFGLFRRAIRENKGVRELVYDTKFSVGDQQYRMRGRKYVEPSPPWRLWPATTTLYVQLFPASGGNGQPVGAGVLRLTLWGLIKQLLTMQVIGNYGMFDRFIQKLSFYRFFGKSLVNTYIKGRRW
jgi:cholesterol oxidase